jgi:hypothetical protein
MKGLLLSIALASASLLVGCSDKSAAEKASAQEKAQEQAIQELTRRVAALEQKPMQHHYELRNEGARSFRFDPDTGESCISLASPSDWKKPETIRQGCQYQDFMGTPLQAGETFAMRHNVAECLIVGKCNP